MESLLYIPLLTDDIQERNALHNHENAVYWLFFAQKLHEKL